LVQHRLPGYSLKVGVQGPQLRLLPEIATKAA
jgi:hypothetical protein